MPRKDKLMHERKISKITRRPTMTSRSYEDTASYPGSTPPDWKTFGPHGISLGARNGKEKRYENKKEAHNPIRGTGVLHRRGGGEING
jgi:hypothetical protein